MTEIVNNCASPEEFHEVPEVDDDESDMPWWDIGLSPTGDTGSSFRTQNDPQPKTTLVRLINAKTTSSEKARGGYPALVSGCDPRHPD